MTIYTKQDRSKPGITLVAFVDEQGIERLWFAVDFARRKVCAQQRGLSTVETLKRLGYQKLAQGVR